MKKLPKKQTYTKSHRVEVNSSVVGPVYVRYVSIIPMRYLILKEKVRGV